MLERKQIEVEKVRKYVSELYIAVLTQRMSVREALVRFPRECSDATVIAAWHALCHLEADEDLRKKDALYAKEQDEYIEYIAYTLDKGEELAQNIVDSYLPYHQSALIPTDSSFKGFLYRLKTFLCC